jgi:hypothetical protein
MPVTFLRSFLSFFLFFFFDWFRYWGDGGDGSGKNRLGFLLMQVRDELLGDYHSATTANTTNQNEEAVQEVAKETEETDEIEETEENEEEEAEAEATYEAPKQDEEAGEAQEEEEGEGEEEVVEGVEPNKNHLYEVPWSASLGVKKGAAGAKKAGGRPRRGGKSKFKRGVFKDADGNSTLEKTTEVKGTVTVIGDGTIFSEKALPPQARFVVYPYFLLLLLLLFVLFLLPVIYRIMIILPVTFKFFSRIFQAEFWYLKFP